MFDNYNPKLTPECNSMDEICKIRIIMNGDGFNREYEINNEYLKKWGEFGMLLKELFGFDLLNIENLQYWGTDFNFNIKTDGVYLNDKKIKLTKFNYYYKIRLLHRESSFSFDFNKKTISNLANVNLKGYPNGFDYDTILEIYYLIEKYVVYKWYCHEFLFGTVDCHCLDFFDGLKWNIELIFEDKYILHVGGWNYPEMYVKFSQELFNLTIMIC